MIERLKQKIVEGLLRGWLQSLVKKTALAVVAFITGPVVMNWLVSAGVEVDSPEKLQVAISGAIFMLLERLRNWVAHKFVNAPTAVKALL